MIGTPEHDDLFMYNMSAEQFVPDDHPLRRIRPIIDARTIRKLARPLYSCIGRPSITPEQLFLALVAGYVMGITSERKIVMQLNCDMAFRWFVGLGMNGKAWDASTFSQNRRRRFNNSSFMEKLFDDTVKTAMEQGLVSLHASADGTLVRANASFKSFAPIEVPQSAEEFKAALRAEDTEVEDKQDAGKQSPTSVGDQDKGNPSVDFRGEKRGNKTHRSRTDPDCRFVSKGSSGTGAYPGYTVNAVMENRNRILVGVNVEVFRGPSSETDGCIAILDRAKKRLGYTPSTLGADKGYFVESFINKLFDRVIEPHVAPQDRGKSDAHRRVRMRVRGLGYQLSQRSRKKIEELFGEGKDNHGLRRIRRRFLDRVGQEVLLIATVLNYKRLAVAGASGGRP
jgi:transposase